MGTSDRRKTWEKCLAKRYPEYEVSRVEESGSRNEAACAECVPTSHTENMQEVGHARLLCGGLLLTVDG